MKVVAVIPARGGSKSIPEKNIKKFCGKPLIAWTILEAKKSKKVNHIIVSTDSPDIARIAKHYGAEVPFVRPMEFATETAGIEPVMKHAYEWLIKNRKYKADALALLFATNPLRKFFHINEAIKIMKKTDCDSVVSVNETPANHTPFWTLVREKNGTVSLFGGVSLKNIHNRRQDFPHPCYARNELIYLLKPKNLYDNPSRLYGEKIELYATDPVYEVDINTLEDWTMSEIKFKSLNKKK
ncbi:MAG: acylneuraminate cytidylyltransferase family protein [Patescibacteria group bacterium]